MRFNRHTSQVTPIGLIAPQPGERKSKAWAIRLGGLPETFALGFARLFGIELFLAEDVPQTRARRRDCDGA
jgi:hypothetical protein